MGGHMSSRILDGKSKYALQLSDYEEVCKTNSDVSKFDYALQADTKRVIKALPSGQFSLHSLKEVTSYFLNMDQNVTKLILENTEEIWITPYLYDLVKEYFDSNKEILNFLGVLEDCLGRATDNQRIIEIALQHIAPGVPRPGKEQYKNIVEQLRKFKRAGSPFPDDFSRHFQQVYERQDQMLKKLLAKTSKMDKKLKKVRAWRKISSVMFVTTFAIALISSLVMAAVAAPPVASVVVAALAAVTSLPIGSTGKWLNSLWKTYEDTMERQREVIKEMRGGSFVVLQELETIKNLVERMESSISSILKTVEFCLKDADAVQIAVTDMRKKQLRFTEEIDEACEHVHKCSHMLREARSSVIDKIRNPSSSRACFINDKNLKNQRRGNGKK